MGMTMTRNKELPTFYGKVVLKRKRLNSDFRDNLKPKVLTLNFAQQ